eukprot:TRINITY_DN10091_c0_g1_i1.p1 TRINITY_DN10091_c0_g1~~TRINITY_DN10091_c0_g1_i1.p1  ORF type:complete len:131 (+),score=16.35 TRINITY_DN10091_c0_g1_i1:312-704(+)
MELIGTTSTSPTRGPKINKNIHGCAVNCVIISLLLQQLMLLFFNTIRSRESGLLPPRAIFSITMFTIFSLLFLVQIFFHMFKGMSPIQYMQQPQQPVLPEHVDASGSSGIHGRLNRSKQFVPDVLRNIEA